MAISGDGSTVAVGATGEDSGAAEVGGDQQDETVSFSGAVYVFARTGVVWAQQAYVKASNPGAQDRFGVTVALAANGNTLAVGAIYESGDGLHPQSDAVSQSGAAYVYGRSGTTWGWQAYLKPPSPGAQDNFGISLALSGDGQTLAVGADSEDGSATGVGGTVDRAAPDAGAAYVFARSGTTWTAQAYLKASNTGAGDAFGGAVALSHDGSLLAIGAAKEQSLSQGPDADGSDNSAPLAGAAYVFARTGTTWAQRSYLKASNTNLSDTQSFGKSVALSGDGELLAVGADGERSASTGVGGDQLDSSLNFAGAVYLY